MTNAQALKVFYDGGCRVCSREMDQYRRHDRRKQLQMIDIDAPDFDPAVYGRDREAFMARLHVQDASGRFHVGIDAFVQIWSVLPQPGLHLLAALVPLPGIRQLAMLGYALFARNRRYLPRRKTDCSEDRCLPGQ